MKCSGRLLTRDWSRYSAHHVCFEPARVSLARLQRWQIEGHRRYYRIWPTLQRWSLRDPILAIYAGRINRQRQGDNAAYLKELAGPRDGELEASAAK